jgi:hypothetical protein
MSDMSRLKSLLDLVPLDATQREAANRSLTALAPESAQRAARHLQTAFDAIPRIRNQLEGARQRVRTALEREKELLILVEKVRHRVARKLPSEITSLEVREILVAAAEQLKEEHVVATPSPGF